MAKTSLDLIPVQDMPPLDRPEARTPGVADTAIDLAPVRDDPPPPVSKDLTQTAVDLVAIRDLPEDAVVPAARPAPDPAPAAPVPAPAPAPAPGPAGRPSLRPVPSPSTPRERRERRGRGVHAGRVAGGPWETDDRPPLSRRLPFRRSHASHQLSAPRKLSVSRRLADPRRLTAPRRLAGWGSARRPVAGDCVAGSLLATVVPLCLLQVPYAALPQLASTAEPSAPAGGSAAVLRAASLALPFAVAFAPLAALAVRRFLALPVLFAGLIATVAGDVLTGAGTATGTHAAVGGALHGVAAGLTIVASVALVTEHAGLSRRLLAAWWAAVVVAALAVLPGLTLSQQPASGWGRALGPVPWLTLAAVAAFAAYALLASRPLPVSPRIEDSDAPADAPARADAPADAPTRPRPDGLLVIIADTAAPPRRAKGRRDSAERIARPDVAAADPTEGRLGLLVPPALALGVVAVAATYRPSDTIVVAAVCGVAALLVMAVLAVRAVAGSARAARVVGSGAGGAGFVVACAVTGLALGPASAGLVGLRALAAAGMTHGTDGTALALAALAGAIVGAGAGLAASRTTPAARTFPVSLLPAAGLLLAAAGLVAACIAGPFTGPALLGVLAAAVTGGLTAALARAASRTTVTSAMAGVIVLTGATLAGYLAAEAIRAQLAGVTASAGNPVPHGLVAANGWWELLAAAAAVAVALSACARHTRHTRRARRSRHEHVRGTERSECVTQ
ncbi:MAG TPA: hypothetical protein VNV62_05565 [Trebonia sp.]|nr:hypothetical protein [Trebonia sp.]